MVPLVAVVQALRTVRPPLAVGPAVVVCTGTCAVVVGGRLRFIFARRRAVDRVSGKGPTPESKSTEQGRRRGMRGTKSQRRSPRPFLPQEQSPSATDTLAGTNIVLSTDGRVFSDSPLAPSSGLMVFRPRWGQGSGRHPTPSGRLAVRRSVGACVEPLQIGEPSASQTKKMDDPRVRSSSSQLQITPSAPKTSAPR